MSVIAPALRRFLGKRGVAVLEALSSGPKGPTEISRSLGFSVPVDAYKVLRRLQKYGLVERVRWGRWALTPEGERILGILRGEPRRP